MNDCSVRARPGELAACTWRGEGVGVSHGIMNLLCIDIGNTSVHFGRVEDGTVTRQHDIPTRSFDPEVLLAAQDCDGISFCSVAPSVTQRVRDALQGTHITSLELGPATLKGVAIGYPRPNEIGPDRLANALGAVTRVGAPAVVIDMGTATTFDVVTCESGYIGGIIAPGIGLMTRYLHEQTALLPALDPDDLVDPGHLGASTAEAMSLGCTVGFTGMIRALLDRVLAELQQSGVESPSVVFTGGSAGKLIRRYFADYRHLPDLTLLGLEAAFRNYYAVCR